jgi:hypothetical protein
MSEAHKGMTHTAEHRRKISEARKGHAVSAETRQKISEAGKGRTVSEETKRKRLETRQRREFSLSAICPGYDRGWGPLARPAFDESDFPGQTKFEIRRCM